MTEQVQEQDVQLEIVDIVNAKEIIKASIERGVFKAEEISQVAGVFDKFNAFVTHLEEQAKAAQNAEVHDQVGGAE